MDDLLRKIVHINKRQHERYEVEGAAGARFQTYTVKAKIIDVSKGGMFGLFDRSTAIPSILEVVSVDIEPMGVAAVCGLSAYVIRMQADGDSLDATQVKVAMRFDKLSSEQKAELDSFLDALKS